MKKSIQRRKRESQVNSEKAGTCASETDSKHMDSQSITSKYVRQSEVPIPVVKMELPEFAKKKLHARQSSACVVKSSDLILEQKKDDISKFGGTSNVSSQKSSHHTRSKNNSISSMSDIVYNKNPTNNYNLFKDAKKQMRLAVNKRC